MLRKLKIMGNFGDLKTCRRKFLLNYFSEESIEVCGNCDNCNTTFERFDGTIIARNAITAVNQTGQRFGLNYIIEFIRGSQAKTVRDEHKNLSAYGIGADISKDNWFEYFRDLMSQGFIKQTTGEYPTLISTEKSEDVLSGNVVVELIKVKAKAEKKSSLVSEISYPYIAELFDNLKKVRMTLAKGENVPPYIIFSDTTLIELATFLPHDYAEMRKISGVGDLKLQKYGVDFIHEIKNYCKQNNLTSRIDLKTPKRERKVHTKRDEKGDNTYEISLKMFKQGNSISDVAKLREMAVSTIETHLVRFIPTGEIELEEIVLLEKADRIRETILNFGDAATLGKVKETLGDAYSYGEIRAVIATFG
jgi:ATP-dependent DNA helicase RecQ